MSTLNNQHINNQITNHLFNYSDRQDCRVIIEVMDRGRSGKRRAGIYAIAVPYNRFSQTLRSIQRSGGKVCNVSISQLQLSGEQVAVSAEPVLEIINEPISFSTSENASETESIEVKIIDSETFEEHESEVFEDHVVVLDIDDPHIVESIAASEVENIVSPELSEPSVADDTNISEKPLLVTGNDSHLVIEVAKEQIVDIVANVETATLPSKTKKTRASTKTAAGGFNKPKNDKTATKSPRKPKS